MNASLEAHDTNVSIVLVSTTARSWRVVQFPADGIKLFWAGAGTAVGVTFGCETDCVVAVAASLAGRD